MDILDSLMTPETGATSIDDLVTAPPQNPVPRAAARNRAASTAMLADDPARAIENYQLMLREYDAGQSGSMEAATAGVQKTNASLDMKGLMGVLSDPKTPLATKQAAFKDFNNNKILQDNATTLLTNGLAAGSAGEPKEQEDARLSSVDAIRQIYGSWNDVQGIQNGHASGLQADNNSKTFFEMLETYVMPFGNSIAAGKLAIAQAEKDGRKMSPWDRIKAYALPGNSTADLAKRLENIPPEKRVEFAKSLADTISANSGIVFSNNNQFNQFDKASSILEQGGYGSFQQFLDNVSPLLDVIGVGQLLRGASKGARVISAGEKAAKEAAPLELGYIKVTPNSGIGAGQGIDDAVYAQPRNVFSNGDTSVLAKTTATPEVSKSSPELDNLIEERASILGDSSPLLDNGAIRNLKVELNSLKEPVDNLSERTKEIQKSNRMSFKEASKAATKEYNDQVTEYTAKKSRIESQISANADASKNEQRLAELDKKITSLSKEAQGTEPAKLNPIADLIRRGELNSIVRSENPSAPANVIQQANPQQARALHEAVVSSNSDEVAEGLYGVSREQAIINDIAPQIATESGAVTSKVPNIQKNMLAKVAEDNKDILDLIDNTGAIYFTRDEKARAAAKVNDFRNAEGLTMNEPMSSFRVNGGRIEIDAVYGLEEGSFLKGQDAVDQAKFALRNYGVLDSDIQLLRKDGLDHVPVRLEDVANVDGNYLIRVKTSHEIDPTDIGRLETFDVKRNLFDRVSPWVGRFITSPNRWLFDAASTLHPVITGSATVAVDSTAKFEKTMLSKADKYASAYKEHPKARQAKIDDYIREANYNGVAFDRTDLKARGFSPEEIDTLKSWRDFWDAHFYLENYDVVRTLNSQGYQLFKGQNAELFAKSISKDGTIGKVYDPAIDKVVSLNKFDMDALYASNGTYAKLRRPTDFGGVTVEHMIVRNTPTEYLRKFTGMDQVLNYREGYYQIQYKAPRFVDEITRDANGVEKSRKAVAVAGDTVEATTFARRMAGTSGGEYAVRGDSRALQRGGDEWWDLNSASGRIAQRHRGQLLEDGSGLNHLGDGSYIINPVDSAIRSARSIAGRTVSRPMLEAGRARAIAQYGDMFPSNGFGGRSWPKSMEEIGAKGEPTSSRVADARTTYEYLNYLENGYVNGADSAFKAMMNGLADMTGRIGLGKTERAITAIGEARPTSLGKNYVFTAYIASNPLRQLIVQPHQLVRMFSYNPVGIFNGGVFKLTGEYLGEIAGLTKGSEFFKFIENSGVLASVDKQNLVRGALKDAADSTNKVAHAAGLPFEVLRKVGFDMGEMANMLGHMAAVYDSYKRAGKNVLDKTVKDEMISEARAISYEMNFAGDMPYNQTSAAALLQFMQVPHKAMLQMVNRRIPWQTRARMVAFDTLMWGTPTVLIADMLGTDLLPDDPKMRETVLYGMESMMFNKMLNDLFGDEETKISIDFSSLAPYDMHGWQKFFTAMYSGGMHDMLLNSPAGTVFLKDQGRTQNAIGAMQRYFAGFIDSEVPPETFLGVMAEVAKISSGFSNAHKASMMLDAKKQYDKYGATIDKDVNYVEAWAQVFGFGTSDARDLYDISQRIDTKNKAYKTEVENVYKTIKQYYAKELEQGNTDPKFVTAVSGFILNKYKDEPVALQILASEMERDMRDKDDTLLYKMMKASGIPNASSIRDDVKRAPIDEKQKEMILKRIDDVQNARTQKEK